MLPIFAYDRSLLFFWTHLNSSIYRTRERKKERKSRATNMGFASSTPLSFLTYSLFSPLVRILWLLQTIQLDCECVWLNQCMFMCMNVNPLTRLHVQNFPWKKKRAIRYLRFQFLSLLLFFHFFSLAKKKLYFWLFHFIPFYSRYFPITHFMRITRVFHLSVCKQIYELWLMKFLNKLNLSLSFKSQLFQLFS